MNGMAIWLAGGRTANSQFEIEPISCPLCWHLCRLNFANIASFFPWPMAHGPFAMASPKIATVFPWPRRVLFRSRGPFRCYF
ncbi:uncharacterized protein Dere_GG27170 [Drosophila erecta]|uniref:Uncharacterized protein n=1 Tax=Drosophila erecta TaxID=7220 RepID=A0A0Q5T652_DROER|nr:uncharacterized protein Dere_GG27170 [Drosophila erecta]